jgi:ORF6N domain
MPDVDIAELYEVAAKVINQAVKRNIKRFPDGKRCSHKL